MSKWNQNYSKNEPKFANPQEVEAERVIEETDSVQEVAVVAERFVIKVGNDKWLKSWNPIFELCEEKSEAVVLNSDWARGHLDRVTNIKRMKAEIVKL
jgi:hypothetical protein